MTFDGIALLGVVLIVSLACLTFAYAEWRGKDRERRRARKSELNRWRAAQGTSQ
jgi:hypothetical protein